MTHLPKVDPLASWSASLAGIDRLPRGLGPDIERALRLAQRFNEEVVRPCYLQLDARLQDHPDELPLEFIATAARWRLFSRWIPRLYGGEGWNFISLYVFLEEVSSVCVGLANVIGVHYLGVATLMATWNTRLSEEVLTDVCRADLRGQPHLIALAITEPGAGTDMEETELLERITIGTVARPQGDGGYRLDGSKVFISNGHVSHWFMVISAEDRRRAADTGVVLVLRHDDEGFTRGRHENKMGQKACVASELLFTECPIPAARVAYAPADSQALAVSHRAMLQRIIDYVVSSTRAGVAAFAAGVARGSHRLAQDYAVGRSLPRGRLIEQQWAQSCLAEMAKNAAMARQCWIESALANGLGGLYAPLLLQPLARLEASAPAPLWRVCGRSLRHPALQRLLQRRYLKHYPSHWQRHVSGLASMAKFAASDLAVATAGMALELMGADGLRQSHAAEKMLRDAKLLQIYEGTNQLNRVNYFKCSLRHDDAIAVFVREEGV